MPAKGQTVPQEIRAKISRSLTGRIRSQSHRAAISESRKSLDPEASTKLCSKCEVVKSRDKFHKNSSATDGLQYFCKECRKDVDKERTYDAKLRRLYGITLEQYNEMLKRQDGVCKICFRSPKKKSLSVDHCHRTGKVRGLLCDHCNRALGWLQDDPKLLARSIDYLEGTLS